MANGDSAPKGGNGGLKADEGDGSAFWGNLLNQLNQKAGGSSFIFPKDGRTRVRLVYSPKVGAYYREMTTEFRGTERTKYVVWAVNMDPHLEEEPKIKGLILAKTAWMGIVTLLSEGYDLWDPDEGFGVTIVRSGSGLDTSYSVLPSKRAQPLPVVVRDQIDKLSFDDLAKEYAKMRSQSATKAAGPGSSKGGSGGKRRRPTEDDWVDDDEDEDGGETEAPW